MQSPRMDLASYSPATRDILTSFTSTADDPPSVQLAQNRERRRATRRARSGSMSSAGAQGGGTIASSPESLGDEVWHDASLGLPRLRLNHDAASQMSGSPKYQTESGSPASTRAVPLPPVDDTPLQDGGEPVSATTAAPPPPSSTPATAPRRSSSPIAIAEIPPYRGPRTPSPLVSPVVGSPAPASEPGDSGSSAATTPAHVKLVDGGVIARLKAARAAKLKATGGGSPTASPGSSTPLAGYPSTSPPPPPPPPTSQPSAPSSHHQGLPFNLPTSNARPTSGAPPPTASFSPIPSTPDLAEPSAHPSVVSQPSSASPRATRHEERVEEKQDVTERAASPARLSNEQVLADMRARNAAREQSGGKPTIDAEPPATGRLSFSPSPSIIAPPASSFAPPPPRPSSVRSSSTTSSKLSHPSPHKNAPTHPPSPTAQPPSTPPRFEIIHESTPESRAAEIEAWFKGERKGGRIVDLEDWKHHSLSEVEEQTERSSISTLPTSSSHGGTRATHTRNSSLSSLPSIPPPSPRAGRPLSTFSVSSSAGRQLADGSYQVSRAPPPPSPSKIRPAPNIIETAARMLEGYKGSETKREFDKGTDELRRYVEREREILGIARGSSRVVPVDSSSEEGSSRKEQRATSPTRRPLSPELARKAAIFGGDTSAARGQGVFGGVSSDEVETFSQRAERKRKEREVEREKRRREREEREAARRLEDRAGSLRGGTSSLDSRRGVRPAGIPEPEGIEDVAELAEDHLPPPPVLYEGSLFTPPPALPSSNALADPSSWTSRYAVLTADTLEFRPTDSTGHFTPIVALVPSDIRRIEDSLKASHGFKPFAILTRDGEEHLFACTKAIDKVNWVVAFENVADLSRLGRRSRSASSILGTGSPHPTTPHLQSPSKKLPLSFASPHRSQKPASPRYEPEAGIDPIKSATERLRQGVSIKSLASASSGTRAREKAGGATQDGQESADRGNAHDELAYLGEVNYAYGTKQRRSPRGQAARQLRKTYTRRSPTLEERLFTSTERAPLVETSLGSFATALFLLLPLPRSINPLSYPTTHGIQLLLRRQSLSSANPPSPLPFRLTPTSDLAASFLRLPPPHSPKMLLLFVLLLFDPSPMALRSPSRSTAAEVDPLVFPTPTFSRLGRQESFERRSAGCSRRRCRWGERLRSRSMR
ncbi:hypothetical protein BCR35DRAFT_115730 [Leucosporidium creatinivorum]|uniref:PH domain-containing protein n=1 Tax=Leucosporidium creatinivorum TaxID=106004 RepID=A0A1Y2F058_9BASI|nr:hypothetical protein BCR35DRAFT_115730 [Leucosporidium creatinivorum]